MSPMQFGAPVHCGNERGREGARGFVSNDIYGGDAHGTIGHYSSTFCARSTRMVSDGQLLFFEFLQILLRQGLLLFRAGRKSGVRILIVGGDHTSRLAEIR